MTEPTGGAAHLRGMGAVGGRTSGGGPDRSVLAEPELLEAYVGTVLVLTAEVTQAVVAVVDALARGSFSPMP